MSRINGVPQPDRARRRAKQLGAPIKPARTGGIGCLLILIFPLVSVARGARLGLSRQPRRDNGRGRQIALLPSSTAFDPCAAGELGFKARLVAAAILAWAFILIALCALMRAWLRDDDDDGDP